MCLLIFEFKFFAPQELEEMQPKNSDYSLYPSFASFPEMVFHLACTGCILHISCAGQIFWWPSTLVKSNSIEGKERIGINNKEE